MFALLPLVVACAPSAPAPELRAVTPDRGWNGETTDVELGGKNLLPSVTVGGVAAFGTGFEAWLALPDQDVRLEGVELVDFSTLHAQVPEGLGTGLYAVGIRTPAGDESVLEDAFRVTRTRADRLTVSIESGAAPIGDYSTLRLRVEDPLGDLVPTDQAISLTATSAIAARGVLFGPDQLGGQSPLVDGVGILGTLDSDGSTDVKVTSTEADDVTFTARAVGDDSLADGTALVTWQAGAATNAVLSLPFSPFRAVAGTPFSVHIALQDAAGHELPGAYARVLLSDTCSGVHPKVDVFGEADVEVTLDTACAADELTVSSDSVDEVTSEPFEVAAADHVGYAVTVTPAAGIIAGVDPVFVEVSAIDSFGNVVPTGGSPLTLTDSLAGVDSPRTSCDSFLSGVAICSTYLRRTGADVVRIVDTASLRGESTPVQVEAGTPASLTVDLGARETVAGGEVGATVAVLDAYNNLVDFDPAGLEPVTFVDDSHSVVCAWAGATGDGHQSFLCSFTTAWVESEVTAAIARFGVSAVAPDSITVHNAALADVSVTSATAVVAGSSFALSLQGFDEYGNAYVRQTDPLVDLSDSTGTLSITSATLGADGTILTAAVLTRATDSTHIRADQYGVRLGQGAAISVSAAGMDHFAVVAPAWVGLGDAASVEVRAEDVYDNTFTGYNGTVSLSVTGDACDATTLSDFADGVASGAMDCGTIELASAVSADDGTWEGTSEVMDVVDLGCAAAPVPDLTLDGTTDPRVCLTAGFAAVTADSTGSTASGAIVVTHFRDDHDTRVRSAAGSGVFSWLGAGPREVEALVVDDQGCGATVSGWAWVGEDDGEPTGPVDLSASASSVATGGSVSVDVLAHDCTGDVAVGQDIFLRANLGTVAGTASGSGLTLTLDGAGEGSVNWSFPAGFASVATLFAGSESAGGYGTVAVAVTQDSARPHVVSVSPAGLTGAQVDEIVVEFDEPLLSTALAGITLTGPSGAVATTVSLDEEVLTVTPSSTLDASSGTFTLVLPSSLRDEAGNRLDGAWTGAATAFTAEFGAVAETLPTLAGCSVSTSTFRPDGDAGAGSEADDVSFTPITSASPTWWAIDVEDAGGSRIRTTRASGASVSIAWDGLGDDGLVVQGGTYVVTVSAIDATDNAAEVCAELVDVDHRLELP